MADANEHEFHGRVTIRNERGEIDRAEDAVLKALEMRGYPESARFAVRLALEEAISNAFHHGHRDLPADKPVHVEWRVEPEEATFTIEDQGPGFTPESVPDPRLDENLELPSGRGMLLMRAYMTRVEYQGRGNRVSMTYRPGTPPQV